MSGSMNAVEERWLRWMLANGKPSARWAKPEYIPTWPLQPDTWYRTPFYKDDHMIDPVEPDTALCGRPLEPLLWDSLVYQAEMNDVDIGPCHIYLSQRKSGKCAQCKNTWQEKGDALMREAGYTPESRDMKVSKTPSNRLTAHRLRQKMTMVKRAFDAEEVEDLWAA